MAITTNNGKLSLLSFGNVVMPNLPMSPGTLGQDDQQQLLWGFPEILWGESAELSIGGIHLYLKLRQQLNFTLDLRQSLDLTLDMRQELNNTGVYLGGQDN